RKGVEDTAVDDDFEIALDEAAAEDNNNRPKKLQKTGRNKKRVMKKRFAKSNTAESSGNIPIFDTKNIKKGLKNSNDSNSNPRLSKKKIIKSRPGKARRQKERKNKK
ncbi:10868_t:CDS:2, partial [Dentiscutata erythropus]